MINHNSSQFINCKYEEVMKDKGLPKGIARGDSVVIIYGKRPKTRKTIWYGSEATL